LDTLGLALIVGGAALVCSGLVFLLPTEHKSSGYEKSIQKDLNEIEGHLRQLRRERGDLN
jgi:hypothetical protein